MIMKVITECTLEDTILINEPVMENFEDGNYEIIESIITNIHSQELEEEDCK